MPEIEFVLNGRPHVARDVDPNVTLLHYLRGAGFTGTKEGCAEGECGACAVAFVARGPGGEPRYEAVNACLVLLPSAHGREVVTVEGVGREGCLHPVQRALAEGGGSQCGYCTPGFVVSLFAEYHRAGDGPLDPESIAGNLCRCTGYRPLRDATVALSQIRTRGARDAAVDGHAARLASAPAPLPALDYQGGDAARRYVRPTSLAEALRLRAERPELTPISGGTDAVVEVNQRHARHAGYLALDALDALRTLERTADGVRIGAGVSLAELEERLHAGDPTLGRWPMLEALLPLFSSRLIRTRATLGGNLGTASPIGDSPPALLALDAAVELARLDADGSVARRVLPLAAFFLDYRKTARAPEELIVAVHLPTPAAQIQRFEKVSKRRLDDISTVAGAFALDLAPSGRITRARLAFGGVAATPVRVLAAEEALVGRLAEPDAFEVAAALAEASVRPMDDHRGSARYRKAMVGSLVRKLAASFDGARDAGAHPGAQP